MKRGGERRGGHSNQDKVCESDFQRCLEECSPMNESVSVRDLCGDSCGVS